MNHHRKAIRAAIVSLLKAGGTLADQRVFDTTYRPRVQFPALVVLAVGEDQQMLSEQGLGDFAERAVHRVLHLDVNAEIQKNAGAEDERDDLLGQVEALLANAAAAGAIPGIQDITPDAMRVEHYGDGEKPIEVGRQRFRITYLTTQADPGSAV